MKRLQYLHILHRAGLRHAQHVEQLQDQLLNVLEGVLLRRQVWVDLLLYLKVTNGQKRRFSANCR